MLLLKRSAGLPDLDGIIASCNPHFGFGNYKVSQKLFPCRQCSQGDCYLHDSQAFPFILMYCFYSQMFRRDRVGGITNPISPFPLACCHLVFTSRSVSNFYQAYVTSITFDFYVICLFSKCAIVMQLTRPSLNIFRYISLSQPSSSLKVYL